MSETSGEGACARSSPYGAYERALRGELDAVRRRYDEHWPQDSTDYAERKLLKQIAVLQAKLSWIEGRMKEAA